MVDSSGGDIRSRTATFRRLRITRFCPTVTRRRSSRRTAGWSGCACRAWIHRASSARVLDPGCRSVSGQPFGVYVPAGRRYIPGTLVKRIWWAPGGWLVVTDALLMGPWHHDSEQSATHHRAPTDYEAADVLLRLIRCVNGQVQVDMECIPMFDYGRAPARWAYVGDGYRRGRGTRRRKHPSAAVDDRSQCGLRGHGRRRTHVAQRGRQPLCRLVLERSGAAANTRGGVGSAGVDLPSLAALAGSRYVSRPSLARPPAAQRADAQGASPSPRRVL